MVDEVVRVFLADDHAMVREGIAALVDNSPGFEVAGQCSSGLDVLPMVLATQPEVLVLDITMPGLNGLDICREVTRKVKGTVVLMLTIHDEEQFAARAIQCGASGFLPKDAAAEELIEALQAVSKGGVYFGKGVSSEVLKRLRQGRPDPYDTLTKRECQILRLIAEGKTSRQIAEGLGVALKTVDTHRSRLMQKLNIHDQTALVKYAIRRGIITAD
jgi:DNA-binding NarL/FixJ family response regulator